MYIHKILLDRHLVLYINRVRIVSYIMQYTPTRRSCFVVFSCFCLPGGKKLKWVSNRCWRCLRATQPHGRDALRANMGETLLNATHPIPAPKGLGQIRKQSTIGCFLSYVSTSCVCLHLIQPHPELSSAATCIRVQKWDGSATASAGLTLARHDRRA
jgi:hypothetical protein